MSKIPTRSWLALVALGAAAFVLTACSEKPKDPADAGTNPDTADVGQPPGLDAGQPDAYVPPPCQYDDECKDNERCDSGKCIAADPCQDDPSTCRGFEYCDPATTLGCRCMKSALAEAPYNGFCKRRLPACAPCKNDEQCGSDPAFFNTSLHNEGACVQMPGMDTKVCLERFTDRAKCGCGESLQLDSLAYCAPQAPTTCKDGAFICCSDDSECPPEHPLCDTDTGLCRDSCKYDFAEEETVGCRADLVCNVNPAFLDEKMPNFGSGTCAKPCTSDAQCKAIRSDFVCQAEPGAPGSAPRCRPPGCLDSFECGSTPDTTPYKSFCQRSSGQCICDPDDPASQCFCRFGDAAKDPVTGTEIKDCKPGYKCDQGTCVEQNCIEQGGADLACNWDEFCCGEDRNGNGIADDLCVNDAGIELANYGQCYASPRPPWCKTCSKDSECVGGGAPSSAIDPNMCLDLTGSGTTTCMYACSLLTQCPKGYGCNDLRVGCSENTGGDPSTCGDPKRCKQNGVDQDGNPMMYCSCTIAGAKGGECPNTTRCNDSGAWCIYSKLCTPNAARNCQEATPPGP